MQPPKPVTPSRLRLLNWSKAVATAAVTRRGFGFRPTTARLADGFGDEGIEVDGSTGFGDGNLIEDNWNTGSGIVEITVRKFRHFDHAGRA
jgi:hypothetical protein